jgi:outer membrane receptor protein involved in Fe transport
LRNRLYGASLLAMAVAFSARAQPSHGIEEVVVTAQKRSEKLQKVPMSVQVLDGKKLEQLQITEFQDYIKYLPSVTAQTLGPNQTTIYMRGISSGDNANHSGPLPTVGTYFDEFPTTTIGGNLDIHIYDTARIEALPGPQGTLFGASSESGTLRVISNPPNPSKFEAGYELQGNSVEHGGLGGVAEGFVNIPVTDKIAIRLVGFDEHDAGFIDNIPGTRTFDLVTATATVPTGSVTNDAYVKKGYNPYDSFGGRGAIRFELPDDWTVTPSVILQDQHANGAFFYAPSEGKLDVQQFGPDSYQDKWVQAGVTVQGKIGDFDLTYAGGYFVRDDISKADYTDYTIQYESYGSGANWLNSKGQILPTPQQEIYGKDHFTKESNELRIASPQSDRLRFIFGLFQEIQTHRILQDYQIAGFDPYYAVPGWANTIWLTDQLRTDRDEALFGELSYDILPNLTLLAGVRPYWYDNSLKGFFGYSANYDALTGFFPGMGPDNSRCLPGQSYADDPCVDLNKTVSGSGETHKINLTYKIDSQRLVYFTYSTGYRPGGINRNAAYPPYQADSLTNYELGFKSTWLDQRLLFNVALYDEDWTNFQYSFLGANSLTVIENAPAANIKGAEIESQVRATDDLTFTAGATLTDAKLTENYCGSTDAGALISTCTGSFANGNDGAAAGTQLPYTPSFKGNVTARYTFDIMDWSAFVEGSGVLQTRTQVGLRDADKLSLGSMPSYGIADFSAGVSRDRLSFSIFVKNAFNALGQENRFVACGSCSTVYVYPVQPLTVGFKLAQRF